MIQTTFLRTTLAVLAITLSGCAVDPIKPTGGPSKPSTGVHVIVLSRGQQVVTANGSLTVKLVEINDSRCPAKVTCIWAGHATVTLQVSKSGSPAGRVTIGTEAPPNMELPRDASYGGHLFHLVGLESGNADGSTQDVPSQRATIKVSRLQEP